MLRVSRVVPLIVFGLGAFVFLWCGIARAQASRPQSLHVLEIDSDDADEQAEALTGALRSRVRSAPGWVLLDTTQSLSMLTAALRCPPRPDAGCLQRIGDQLKTDRFVWGLLSKAPGHQVTADVHLWMRGKPDQSVKETYSDNLKDQNDDTLRKIASRFFDRLTGGPAGTVLVHLAAVGAVGAPWTGDGTIVVDDSLKVPADHGSATVLLAGGPHVLEVQATGFTSSRQSVVVTSGQSQDLNVELTPVPVAPPPSPKSGSSRTAIIVGTLVGGGAVLVAGGVLGIVYESERSKLSTDTLNNYGTFMQKVLISDPCHTPYMNLTITNACSAVNEAKAVVVPEIVSLSVGGALVATGVILLVTDHKETPAQAGDWRLLPGFGPGGGSLAISGVF
jgi:hypothetical protein